MRRVCFLSTDNLDGYTIDDDLAIEPLRQLGWHVDTVSWRDKTVDWNIYEAVVLRTTWDYQQSPEEFIKALEKIDATSARLENPIDIVRWNLSKTYLRDLEELACRIVPTLWNQEYSEENFGHWIESLHADELIIKPLISATAQHTYRLNSYDPSIAETFQSRDFMVQPFMPAIVTEGEYSLFYFDGEFSHAINKAPKTADFRVQEEHGGLITAVEPDAELLEAGRHILELIEQELLYARVDFVCDGEGEFALMELELIEPALYFRMDESSPAFFAEQFHRRMNEL